MARHFKHWLKAYCDYTRFSEAPLTFHFWTGVWTLAGALRRRVWQDQFYFHWVPNFYIILVGPAGAVKKSTSLNLGKELLTHVDGAHFGPDSGSWQGLGDALADSCEYFEYTNGTGDLKRLPHSAVSIAASELGTFLHPDDESAISFLTDAWDGRTGKYIHRTKHSGGIEIENAWLNIIGGTTPSWIRRNLPESMIGEGLISRIVFVYADAVRTPVALPSRLVGMQDRSTKDKLIEDLQHIAKSLVGPYEFTDDVKVDGGWMDVWYAAHNATRPTHMASDRYGGYLSRKQTHMVKLAIVLAAAKRDTLIITKDDLIEADSILVSSETSMIKVFEAIGVVDEAKHVGELVAFVRAYQWITARDLYYNCCYNIMKEYDYKQAVRLAVDGGLLAWVRKGTEMGLSPKPKVVH